jgi:hypothetical protein
MNPATSWNRDISAVELTIADCAINMFRVVALPFLFMVR